VSAPREPLYVCGHGPGELARLESQGAFFEEITRHFFQKAGLTRGMRVLDLGCGAGDVSFLAAELVGPTGLVLGVDRAAEAIATARARAEAHRLAHIEFRQADLAGLTLSSPVDAVVGRFVLMHQADPARTLGQAARLLGPHGLVAILESHLAACVAGVHSHPHAPAYDSALRWMVEVIEAAGAHPDMGLRLRQTFLDAGLPSPDLWLQARVEGGPDAAIFRYTAESVRSMLTLAERLGVPGSAIGDVDDLERRLREEVVSSGGVLTSPLVVGAWCTLP
jgi:SAM-dependent methyltransferase